MALFQDIRTGFRQAARRPGSSLLAVLSLSLAIGITVVLFSVLESTVLDPLPFPDDHRLLSLYQRVPTDGHARDLRPSDGDWVELARAAEAGELDGIDGLAAIRSTGLPITLGDRVLAPLMREASRGYFSLLGVAPAEGRTFSAEETRIAGPDVVLLSHEFWQRELGGADVVGEGLILDGRSHTVVGILPAGFTDPLYPTSPVLWLPLRVDESGPLARGGRRGERAFLRVFARLERGAGLERANEALGRLSADLAARFTENEDRRLVAKALLDDVVEDHRAAVLLLFVAVCLVLAIACVNVGSLQIARLAQRSDEVAMRRALGAGLGHLARQLVAESLALGSLGGLGGVLLAVLLMPWAAARVGDAFGAPAYNPIDLHWRVLGFAVAVTLGASLFFGLAPLRAAGRVRAGGLGGSRATGSSKARRARRLIVASQLALSVVLLAGAGLTVRTLLALDSVPAGFVAEDAVMLRTGARGAFEEPDRWLDFHRGVRERLARLPGVVAVGGASVPPLFDGGAPMRLDLGELSDAAGRLTETTADAFLVGEGLFEALGTPVLRGRSFGGEDRVDGMPVMMVSRAFAERFLRPLGVDPVGAVVRVGDDLHPRLVLGVVGDIRQPGVRPEPVPRVYFPIEQATRETVSYVLRLESGDPVAFLETATAAIQSWVPEAPVYAQQTVAEAARELRGPERMLSLLLSGFSLIALLLAVLGTYAALTQSVGERRSEFGIRMAFGARPSDILGRVRREAGAVGLLGLAGGMVVSLLASRLLASRLYGVTTADPLTYLGVAGLLLSVVLCAALLPAWRASRLEPAKALRR